ncbi:hypothetical protein DPMN_181413 [Dreissena polymorpha]|uniref:Uncharacterized protein n=1 Tax=Dreissena polymorpha TaxID=45954 RepID=A0A9D4I4E0_DREPO|nr:hypothetical protein DPMN_181413 [Dreissena polymorpha]
MGQCIAEIDLIVIREVQYQFEVNRCRNEEMIVKGNFGWAWPMWAWPMWAGFPRRAQYQFEVNRCRNEEIKVKGNFGLAWPMWPGRPRIDRIVIREAQYQFEVNRCRNEEVNFQGSNANSVGGAGGQDGRTDGRTHITTISPLFSEKHLKTYKITRNGAAEAHAGAPGLVMGPCTYQLEVNRCRNEEIIVKGNFGWAWPMWAGRPMIGYGAMHIEVNRCRNEEIIVKGNFGWAWPMWAGRPRFGSNFNWAWPMWAWPM